ncbi:hypothetical protein BY458DRAFT_513918 [Sporodiniella umbellata]|nr:hypothetical protein BY458DRAFT_513918 [Sporodiniella umbellata]
MYLEKKITPWKPVSFELAKYLLKNEIHKQFLTTKECTYFENASSSFSIWIAFISLQQQREDKNADVLGTTVFRVRSMLYEQLIPYLFYSDKPCCQQIPLDDILRDANELEIPKESEIAKSWNTFLDEYIHSKDVLPPITENELDSKDSTSETGSKIPFEVKNATHDTEIKKENDDFTNAEAETELKTKVAQADKTLEEITMAADSVPIIDIFHTLELDRAAMVEQRKLEEFEAQEELNEAEEEKENLTAKSLSIFNADGNFNLKYLLQGIVANREKTSLSDRELHNLLSDFKPHRSKWASDERVGQEELYEACDKVLTDLKNYTEHSMPFLNKVSKREAPDYFDVIKNPMDLGTVTKKMKNLNYRSKKEFGDDLYLIYDNCLMYNTNSASEYRKHAIAMRRKTERLLTRVPDISIKDKMDNEIEEEGDEISEEEEMEATKRPSKKSLGKHTVSSKSGPISYKSDRFPRERSLTRGSSAAPTGDNSDVESVTENGISQKSYGGKTLKNQEGDENVDLEQEDKKLGDEIDADLGEIQGQIWREKTKKTRARITTDIEKQYQYPFSDREALVRSGLDMERFSAIQHLHHRPESLIKLVRCENDKLVKWIDHRPNDTSAYELFELDSSDDENLDAFFSKKITKAAKQINDSAKSNLFLPDYKIMSGIPEIDGVPEDLSDNRVDQESSSETRYDDDDDDDDMSEKSPPPSFDIYCELAFPDHGLGPMIDRNIQTLEKIRLTYGKCNAVRNNAPISALISSIESNTATGRILHKYPTKSSMSEIPPLCLNNESGHQMCQKIISKLLTHAGFEGAKTGAINILSDIMIDYMMNIGKTIRAYWDDYGQKMTGDDMLLHTLYENGVMDLADLETYVQDDVEKNVNRLEDIYSKLQNSYQDFLSGSGDKMSEDEESLLNDEEAFIAGAFGEDFGDDYFGFKSIGLDKEYNLETLNIPTSLILGKSKEKLTVSKHATTEPDLKHQPPPKFLQITSGQNIIGLLQSYFEKRLGDSANPLIEDEFIPNRNKSKPRYPPTTKNVPGRKKIPKEASTGGSGSRGDIRKYKKKRPTEEINAEKAEKAEKKRLRMEEKAHRMAEKEQRKKLKEELKEQEKQAKIEAKEKKKAQNKKVKPVGLSSKSTNLPSSDMGESPMQIDDDDEDQ